MKGYLNYNSYHKNYIFMLQRFIMKILYIANNNYSNNDGITKKILNQISIWRKYGHEVIVLNLSGKSLINDKKFGIFTFRKYNYIVSRLISPRTVINYINYFCPDIIYVRYDSWYRLLQYISHKYKVVLEINTNQIGEYAFLFKNKMSIKSFLRKIFVKIGYILLSNRVAGIIAVSPDAILDNIFSRIPCKKYIVPNSINIAEYPILKKPKNESKINFFFIGSEDQEWHGLDIIENLAAYFTDYEFHIVGSFSKSKNRNIYYYGKLEESSYNSIMESCDICIGTLALFRKGMKFACPLKVREYLAKGFPVIIGYEEMIDLSVAPFILKIDPLNINYIAIDKFCKIYKDYIVSHNEILELIGSEKYERQRISIFKQIIGGREFN
jgi:hypothetical protein